MQTNDMKLLRLIISVPFILIGLIFFGIVSLILGEDLTDELK